MKYRYRILALLLLLCLCLSAPALAAQDITEWITEYVTAEVSNVPLYEARSRFGLFGEILYNDLTGAAELSVSGEGAFALRGIELADGGPVPAEGESPFELPEGYVFVTVRAESRGDTLVCMPAEFAQSPAERRAAREAAAAQSPGPEETPADGEDPETVPAAAPEPAEPADELAVTAPVVTAPGIDPSQLPAPEKKFSLMDVFRVLDMRDYVYIIIILSLVLVALIEMAFLIIFRRRAENLARSYLRSKKQLEQSKRSLSVAKSLGMQKDRELVELRDELAELSGEYRAPAPAAPSEEESRRSPGDYEYKLPDYEWKF